MSESGGSQPQDASDEDIYKDFSDFNFGDELAKLEHSKETIKKEVFDLSEQVKVLTKENEELKKSNEILKRNVSTLLKTAQAEVQRKDSMIEELRNKLDSLAFRRKTKSTKDVYTSTQDLEFNVKLKNNRETKDSEKKRSNSKDCRTSSDSEKKFHQEEHKKRDSEDDREGSCDNNRKFASFRDSTRRKCKYSESNHEGSNRRSNERCFEKSTNKCQIDYRNSSTENLRGHSKYHSLDRRKRSRSSSRRFTNRRRNSRERRSGRMEESPERWRREKKEDFENIQRRRRSGRGISRSRERSKDGKESSFEHMKLRSSPGKDPGNRSKEISNKLKETNSVKTDNDGGKKERESLKEKNKTEVKVSAKAKRMSRDENSVKNEKTELDKFSTKSPLDALYSEMITSKTSSRFSKLGSGATKTESNLEEGVFALTDQKEPSPAEEEDWTLSFKNERRDTERPMTLYSKRMMQRLTEAKKVERLKPEEKEDPKSTEIKNIEIEKEPGELTDEENIIESTKEFQELAKVAIIESAIVEKGEDSEVFKEPMTKEVVKNKPEGVEAAEFCKEAQPEIRDVIEYSPFKNNYRLIEISPIKPPDKEQLMEMYNKRTSTGQIQKEVESSIFNLLSSLSGVPVASKTEGQETKEKENKQPEGEKQTDEQVHEKSDEKIVPKSKCHKNMKSSKKSEKEEKSTGEESKSEKSDEMVTPGETTQFLDFFLLTTSPSKQIIPGHPETPGKMQNDANLSDPKFDNVNSSSDTIEEKNCISSKEKREEEMKKKRNEPEKQVQKKQDKSKDGKKKENENKTDGKSQKRKREIENEPEPKKRKRESGSESESKKAKPEKSPRKRTRSQQNSCKTKPETKPETKMKEDITTFQFFKPIAKKDNLDTSTECKMTTMSVANIVCLETPNKGVKNLMINEQMILNVLDAKNPALCSPLMTPRRMLKNDLMLTDSEDDSGNKGNVEEEEEEEEEGVEMSEGENSECGSDSGASDFVDLL